MANELEKYEGAFLVPSGGYSVSVTEVGGGGGPFTVTVPAGTYYPTSTTSLLTTLASQLTAHASLSGTYSASLDDTGAGATGKVTLSATGITTFEIAWTSITLRNWLGWTGTITGALTYTSPEQMEYLWLPPVAMDEPEFPVGDIGWEVSDYTATVSPSGYSKRLAYARRYQGVVKYRQLRGSRVWVRHEVVVNESLQKFWRDVIQPGKAVRFHKDRSDDATYVNWVLLNGAEFKPSPDVPGWQGVNSIWSWGSDLIEAL